jgi:hypothetical protein
MRFSASRFKRVCAALFILIICTPFVVHSVEWDPWVRAALSSRDINHRPGNNTLEQDGWFLEARLGIQGEIDDGWSWFVDTRALAASDNSLFIDESNDFVSEDGVSDSYFLQLREAYIRYDNLTPLPGEYLKIGLQRLDDGDGLWWDTDIESIAWHGDTTQLDWLLAVGKELDSYRTDADLFAINDNVLRIFGAFDWDWTAYHSIGFSYMKQKQDTELSPQFFSNTSLGYNASLEWYGIKFMSNWHEKRITQNFAYKIEWIKQNGDSTQISNIGAQQGFAISADAIDAGFRFDLNDWSFGITHTRGSGGMDAVQSSNFSQSGLHSNRGRYFGGRQRLFRFSEALRADITNLSHTSIFITWQPTQNWEAALLLGDFQKVDSEQGFYSLGREIDTISGASDIGKSADINVTYYPDDNNKYHLNLLRLRAGFFDPSETLIGSDSDYRVTIDAQFRY